MTVRYRVCFVVIVPDLYLTLAIVQWYVMSCYNRRLVIRRCHCIRDKASIVLFRNISSSGEQPEQRVIAHTLWQSTSGWIAIFNKYCCFIIHEGTIEKNLTLLNPCTDVSNATMWVYEAWIKRCCVLCSNHIEPWAIFYNPTRSRHAVRGARIFETRLLPWLRARAISNGFTFACTL